MEALSCTDTSYFSLYSVKPIRQKVNLSVIHLGYNLYFISPIFVKISFFRNFSLSSSSVGITVNPYEPTSSVYPLYDIIKIR